MRGLIAIGPSGTALFETDKVVIATGGIGGLYAESTNPLSSFGQGVALAARAGAVLADMEFVQFHPTALDVPLRPMPLVSEAVRGEGAKLIDARGERFMAGVPGAELAPRDVVARAIARLRQSGGRAFLDARAAIGDKFAARFPAIADACRAAGIDPAREPMPVRPAQHYHMGGIAVDAEGRSLCAIESRFSRKRCAPYGEIDYGDIILVKEIAGPICGIALARRIWFYSLAAEPIDRIRCRFGADIGGDDAFWMSRASARYATLIELDAAAAIAPVRCDKRDRRGWAPLRSRQMGFDFG